MKLLSVIIPCYNSQDYMRHCIETLLPGGEEVELLLINDGSSDHTSEIAHEYEAKYPAIVRAIDQENKGHGGALNTGIAYATGTYIKVVDSDDWVDEVAYKQILNTLRSLHGSGGDVDLLISNFVYDKVGVKNKKIMSLKKVLPENQIFGWEDTKRFTVLHYMLMHSMIYRTELVRACHLKLPEHQFYVDNLWVYVPLPYVEKMYYMDVNFYHYFIGREDQSVNEKVMIGRIDQQIRVNYMILDAYDVWSTPNEKQRRYMLFYQDLITMVTSILLIKHNSPESIQKKRKLWAYIKKRYPRNYRWMMHRFMPILFNLPKKCGNRLVVLIYWISKKLFGFN